MSGWLQLPRRLVVASASLLLATALSACPEDDAGTFATTGINDFGGPPNPNPGFDVGIDVAIPDGFAASAAADGGPEQPNAERAEFVAGVLKDAPGYIVPADVARKEHLALSATQAAWVQVDIKGKRRLVTWDLFSGGPPQVRSVQVIHPRELAISDEWLVWVDDTFDADGDIFALSLAGDSDFLVVGAPQAQRRPAVLGSVVVWEDCRTCVDPNGKSAPELYRRDLDGAPTNEQLTADGVLDRFPALGTLANGSVAVAWLRGASSVRVLGGGVDVTFDTNGTGVEGVALSQGRVAFRAQPAIINPDSMIPTDPWAIEVASGAQTTLATGQSITGKLPSGVVGLADGRFAWLAQNPADPSDASVVVADPVAGGTVSVGSPGALQMTGGGDWIGFVAPRADNGGETDVWLAPAP